MANPEPSTEAGPAPAGLPAQEILPIRAVVVTLAFTEAAAPRFFHQPAVTAFVRTLLGGPEDYDIRLTVDCPETGRIAYRAGDRYRFTLVSLAGGEALLDRALAALLRLPRGFPLRDPGLSFRPSGPLTRAAAVSCTRPTSTTSSTASIGGGSAWRSRRCSARIRSSTS